jgi:hypothetical protein
MSVQSAMKAFASPQTPVPGALSFDVGMTP